MIISSSTQIYYFFCTTLGGIIAGLMIDAYRSIRYWSRPKGILAAVSDMLFWILCAIIIFIFFLYTNNGDFRYYTIIGMGLGVLLYFKVISPSILKIMRWLIYYTGKAIRLIWMVLLFPIKAFIYIEKLVNSLIRSFFHKHKPKLNKKDSTSKNINKKEGKSKGIKNNKINTDNKLSKKKNTRE